MAEEPRKGQGASNDDTTVVGKKLKAEDRLPGNVQASLVVVEGQEVGKEYPIEKSTVTLGRDKSAVDCMIPDPGVSRRHAAISYQKDGFQIEDLDSTNGTLVNGKVVRRGAIRNGDRVQVGDTVLQFILESSGASSKVKVYELDVS